MKRFTLANVAVVVLLGGVAYTDVPAFAADKCDNPKDVIDQRACAKAAEGADALRRFVERTRMIYSLYYYDYVPGGSTAATAESSRVPDAKASGTVAVTYTSRT